MSDGIWVVIEDIPDGNESSMHGAYKDRDNANSAVAEIRNSFISEGGSQREADELIYASWIRIRD